MTKLFTTILLSVLLLLSVGCTTTPQTYKVKFNTIELGLMANPEHQAVFPIRLPNGTVVLVGLDTTPDTHYDSATAPDHAFQQR